jgi:predicted RNase H-like nuclease
MSILLVGFDSAWTPNKQGALAGATVDGPGQYRALGAPQPATFTAAEATIDKWQRAERPLTTLILLDQPTIVRSAKEQRPVERLVGSSVGRRYGGMQPAYTGKAAMFGVNAPLWRFLDRFGGPADPFQPATNTLVLETYPVFALIALGWVLPDEVRANGRLPKYNPARSTFRLSDWRFVCANASHAFRERSLEDVADWIEVAANSARPRKSDQDQLDACLCLLVALHLVEQRECLVVGDQQTGYIVVPHDADLVSELEARCGKTKMRSQDWIRVLRFRTALDSATAQ